MENNIYKTLKEVKNNKGFIDLMTTDFSIYRDNGINDIILNSTKEFIYKNEYKPDSKGLKSARIAIQEYYNNRKIQVDAKNIFITSSTSESYSLLFHLFKKNDEVLLPNPTYPLFENIASFSNVQVKYYNLNENKDWDIDLQSLENNINKHTKAIILINPNNPTGSVIKKESFNKLIKIAEKHKISIIIDEVFENYLLYSSYISNINVNNIKTNVFILNGISKLLCLPEMKLAWICANNHVNENILEELELNNDTFLNCNYLIQYALPKLLTQTKTCKNNICKIIKENLNTVIQMCEKNKKYFSCNHTKGGIFVMLQVNKNINEEDLVIGLLHNKYINTHPGYFYDYYSTKPHLVISLLNNTRNFKNAIDRISDYVIE